MKHLVTITLLALSVALAVAEEGSTRVEIQHLLNVVADADVVFIRNGKDHTAKDAVEHMQKKRDHFKDKIKTTEDFIAYSATKSLMSGKVYQVRMGDGVTKPCAEWLLEELKRFRARSMEDADQETAPPTQPDP